MGGAPSEKQIDEESETETSEQTISMRRNNCILIGLRFSNSDCDPTIWFSILTVSDGIIRRAGGKWINV